MPITKSKYLVKGKGSTKKVTKSKKSITVKQVVKKPVVKKPVVKTKVTKSVIKAKITVNKIPRDKGSQATLLRSGSEATLLRLGKDQQNQDETESGIKGDPMIIDLSIEIIQQIDPKQKLSKEDLMEILKELQEQTTDICYLEAIGYLLYQLENLEEKLEKLEDYRDVQQYEMYKKQQKLQDPDFKSRITLDSDEKPDPDECEEIYLTTKKVYQSSNRYAKPSTNELKQFKTLNTLKKIDQNVKKQYRI